MKNILLLPFLFITTFVFAQSNNSIVKLSNPSEVNSSKGYSQLAEVNLGTGKMLILSGQVAFDVKDNLVGAGDIGKQTEQVFINIKI
jgi:enamine deaminase RidA (YjgF/YER057c/UK114 family)